MKNWRNLELSRDKFFRLSATGAVLIGLVLAVTFGGNVNINTGNKITFGQGVVQTTSCDSYLIAKLTGTLDATTGIYYVKNLILSDISTQLHDKRVTLSLKDDSGATLSKSNLYFDIDSTGVVFTSPLAHTDVIDYTSLGAGSLHEVGTSSITLQDVKAPDNSQIIADNVKQVTIETSGGGGCTPPVISCANGGTCSVGDTGPGGGTVIYVSATPITLQGQGQTVTKIEIAPFNWGAPAGDPAFAMCQANVLWRSTGVSASDGFTVPSTELRAGLGYGLKNTNYLLNYSYSAGQSCSLTSQAAYKARNANIGGKTDWFLPSIDELNIVCRYANTLDMTSTSTCIGGTLRAGFANSANNIWWSSTLTSDQQMDCIRIKADTYYSVGQTISPLVNLKSVRPIRMF